ncbi:class I SAM-dependent methyltransferase [Kribbella deserti]|uniref:Class I SAM-dependent methyltransferase n=1 Tax=Kribbella deserti TaxID=1926257 RepID=A0ABV6QHT9_9ACTN
MLNLSPAEWSTWMNRWDRQQTAYLPDRETALGLILDVVAVLVGEPTQLVDLASGPGSIALRAGARFPQARVTAVDADPFLLALGQAGAGRIAFQRADLLEPGWDVVLGSDRVDAVCSATSLHYFSAAEFAGLAEVLARRIRPDGVFVNLDTLRLGAEVPRLSELAASLRDHGWDGSPPSTPSAQGGSAASSADEDWASWWAAARAEPAFAQLLAERDRLAIAPTEASPVTLPEMIESLRAAGFAEVGVLRQTADKHLVVAIR